MLKYDLKRSVETLQEIRSLVRKDLDPCVAAELETVIRQLEECVEAEGDEVEVELSLVTRTIKLIGRLIETTLNIAELIQSLTDPQ